MKKYIYFSIFLSILIGLYLKIYDSINDDDVEVLEVEVLKGLYSSSIKSKWINITVENEIWETHLLESSYIDQNKPNILLLHGYGATSAITWRVTIPGLVEKFNVYAVDMPGFGRTPAPKSLLSIDDPIEAHMKYCTFYRSVISSFNLTSPPFIIAHSFGGFVITQCLSKYPTIASGAILIAVPGFFSSNGAWGYVCATYFSFGLPQYPIQLLGDWTHYVYDFLIHINDVNIEYFYVRYWHLVHMSPHMKPDAIVRKFIQHYGIYSMGVGVSLLPLINLTHTSNNENLIPLPVAIVFGSNDFISPPQQGYFINEISGIPTFVIDGANHVAYTHNKGKDFLQIFNEFYSSLDTIPSKYRSYNQSLSLQNLTNCLEKKYSSWSKYPVFPSYYLSKWLFESMFNRIKSIINECANESIEDGTIISLSK